MMLTTYRQSVVSVLFVILLITSTVVAQGDLSAPQQQPEASQNPPSEDQTKDLAKAVQNPVASLISVPLQNNTNFDIGPNNRTQDVLNIQPGIPIRVSENWNLIIRVITPVIFQPSIPLNRLGTLGLGDMHPTFFLSVTGKTEEVDLGSGACVPSTNRYRPHPGAGEMEHWCLAGDCFSQFGLIPALATALCACDGCN